MTQQERDKMIGYLLRVGAISDPVEFQDWHDLRTSTPAGKMMFKRVVAMSDIWWMGFFDGRKIGQQEAVAEATGRKHYS